MLVRGAGRTRSDSSSITPSVPSEPTTRPRSEGPAAVAGMAGRAMSPAGAARRMPTTIFSIEP